MIKQISRSVFFVSNEIMFQKLICVHWLPLRWFDIFWKYFQLRQKKILLIGLLCFFWPIFLVLLFKVVLLFLLGTSGSMSEETIRLEDLLQCLVECCEKAAQIARIFRGENDLFGLLVEEKSEIEKNRMLVQDFKTLADVLVQETIKKDVGQKASLTSLYAGSYKICCIFLLYFWKYENIPHLCFFSWVHLF